MFFFDCSYKLIMSITSYSDKDNLFYYIVLLLKLILKRFKSNTVISWKGVKHGTIYSLGF